MQVANAISTGTANNTLAKLTGAPSSAVIATTADTGGIIGVVRSGGGTSGASEIVVAGRAFCAFENATTAGHYVIPGTGTNGDCRDGGASFPPPRRRSGEYFRPTPRPGHTNYWSFHPTNSRAGRSESPCYDPSLDL